MSGLAPSCIGNAEDPNLDKPTILVIVSNYKDHPSITKIK